MAFEKIIIVVKDAPGILVLSNKLAGTRGPVCFPRKRVAPGVDFVITTEFAPSVAIIFVMVVLVFVVVVPIIRHNDGILMKTEYTTDGLVGVLDPLTPPLV